LLHLGHEVRQCTWRGRPEDEVKGTTARLVLQKCLLLLMHLESLMSPGRPPSEYQRTISLALLGWQDWMSRLPGCVFVEEAGEAMLSRLSSACKRNPHVTSFEGTLQLFLNLGAPSGEAHHSRGSLRKQLVQEMARRVRGLLGSPGDRPFPKRVDSTTVRWLVDPETYPTWMAPEPAPTRMTTEQLLPVLRHSVQTLVRGQRLSADVEEWLRTNVGTVDPDLLQEREEAMYPFLARRRSRAATAEHPLLLPDEAENRLHDADEADTRFDVNSAEMEVAEASMVVGDQEEGSSLYEPPESLYEPPGDLSDGYVSVGASDGLDWLGSLQGSDISNASSDVSVAVVC
jgi:hypothetical protein